MQHPSSLPPPHLRQVRVRKGLEALPGIAEGTELDFHPRLNFIIGDNEAGKTTFLRSLWSELAKYEPQKDDLGRLFTPFNAEAKAGDTSPWKLGTTRSFLLELDLLLTGSGVPNCVTRDGAQFTEAKNLRSASGHPGGNSWRKGNPLDSRGGSMHFDPVARRIVSAGENRRIYLMDEPETTWSIQHQIAKFRVFLDRIETEDAQAIVSTHSPLLLASALDREATVFRLKQTGVETLPIQDLQIAVSSQVRENLLRLFVSSED